MRRLLLLGLLAAGCGIKGSPRPPVQVVPPPAEEPAATPPRPGRDETGVPDVRGPFPPAELSEDGGVGTLPAPLDGGAPLIPDGGVPVPDAPPPDGQ